MIIFHSFWFLFCWSTIHGRWSTEAQWKLFTRLTCVDFVSNALPTGCCVECPLSAKGWAYDENSFLFLRCLLFLPFTGFTFRSWAYIFIICFIFFFSLFSYTYRKATGSLWAKPNNLIRVFRSFFQKDNLVHQSNRNALMSMWITRSATIINYFYV